MRECGADAPGVSDGHEPISPSPYALLDLHTRSTRFIAASLLEAVAVPIGVNRTPGGLHIAASPGPFIGGE